MGLSGAWEQAQEAWRRLAARAGRPSEDGLDALSDIGTVRRMLDQAELEAVRAARQLGKSWAEIATHLGVTRQSAWERWRDLDHSPGAESATVGDAAAELVQIRFREAPWSARVTVPNVVGLEWIAARDALTAEGLVAISAEPDVPTTPGERGWIVTDQSPESGARVRSGSAVRLWLKGDGGAGVREPRRPHPTPRSAREMRPEPRDQAVG
ncbi:PASTA domain-containing protein [Mycobacterium sp. 852002-51057_SCH5723018]|uniref:PASTA domain-containing protein n=1 Tax=Mycobacterium sp. 852002-51057_SCH5723018 TaxID=1834094 RepID=UPI0009EDC9BF|nr:PASTA domain-containing protein [Mycobacterium sp. 852002-51057_SCH5723018]